jgi:hypothetical protein
MLLADTRSFHHLRGVYHARSGHFSRFSLLDHDAFRGAHAALVVVLPALERE